MYEITIQFIKTFGPYILVIGIIGVLCKIYYSKVIGFFGEFHVKNKLKKLPKENYLTLNDIMISINNETHQIDHIVVSPYGIFVIETKQYNGYIKGNEYDLKWKQNNKFYINNPIHQNYGHVKALMELLNIKEDKFIPIICIPSKAKVNVKSKSHVLRLYTLNTTIESYKTNIIDNYKDIYELIKNSNIIDKNKRKQHVQKAKNIKKQKEINNLNKCPLCGGTLVKRNGKYGEFTGCSNYPKCKYIKK